MNPGTADPETSPDLDINSPGRVGSILNWLRHRTDTAVGRLALQWFRGYLDASNNSACAVAIYASLSVLPAALVAVAFFHPLQSNANVLATHLVTHMGLTGTTAKLVDGVFGTASSNALAATVTVLITFLMWGIGIGQIYQNVYARAWKIKMGSVADQALFVLFFFLLSGAIALVLISAAELRAAGLLVLVPVWLIASTAFWLLVPSMLLHRRIGLRALLPGALLATIVLGGTAATAPLFVTASLVQNAKSFGAFGVVLTTVGYFFILITLSLVCAVFSPVWTDWRLSERRRQEVHEDDGPEVPLPTGPTSSTVGHGAGR